VALGFCDEQDAAAMRAAATATGNTGRTDRRAAVNAPVVYHARARGRDRNRRVFSKASSLPLPKKTTPHVRFWFEDGESRFGVGVSI
jgi:hypothetical protein